MAVQPGPTFKRYAANGAATVYTIPFLLLDPANLQITLNGVSVTSGFTLAGLGNASSSCTFAVAPVGDLLFQQVMQFQRLTDYQMNGDFLSQTVNGDYDRLWLAIKQLNRDDGRALAVSPLEPEGIPALPVKALRNLKLLAFDAAGNPAPSNLTLTQLEQQPALALASAAEAKAFADEASESADRSGELASQSSDFAVAAEVTAASSASSASIASAISKPFPNTADGITATSGSGAANRFFSVPVTGTSLAILYRNDAGVAIEIGRSPSTKAIEDIASNFDKIDSRNDIMVGFWDLAGKLGLDLTTDGKLNIGKFKDVVAHILALEAKAPEERTDRSGNMASFLDQANAVAVAITNDGSLTNKGRNILQEIDALKSGAANNKWITPSEDLVTFGDSLSQETYQPFLRTLLPDRNIFVGALPGKRSGQIARLQGGIAPMLTIADNIIPASGSVVVSVDVPFLNNSLQISGQLYGVRGVLSAVDNVHYFTRSQAGVAVEIDVVTPFVQSITDTDYAFRTAVIWAGNNDTDAASRSEVDNNVQRMVDYLRPQDKRFIVIGMAIADYPDRHKGTPYYADTMALHKKWRERWPDNFIDITPILQRHYDPNNPTDVQNVIDGCTPSSLRQLNDKVHLGDAGQTIVTHAVYDHIIQRGW